MKHFYLISLSILAILLFAGCSTTGQGGVTGDASWKQQWVKIHPVPAWPSAAIPQIYTDREVSDMVYAALGRRPILNDTRYVAMLTAWLLEAGEWWSDTLWRLDLNQWIENVRDCDKFAQAASMASGVPISRIGVKAGTGVGRIGVQQKVAWGGVPAGGGHALNLAITEIGLIVIEPQSKRWCKAEDYPNKDFIFSIIFGGL